MFIFTKNVHAKSAPGKRKFFGLRIVSSINKKQEVGDNLNFFPLKFSGH